jgi:hypothetical protein
MAQRSTAVLNDGPFGDSNALRHDLQVFHTGLVDMLREVTGTRLPDSGQSLLRQSIRRAYLERAFKACVVQRDTTEATRLINEAAILLDETSEEAEVAAVPAVYALAANWGESRAGRLLVELIKNDLAPHPVAVLDATPVQAMDVARGIHLLIEMLGELATGTLACVSGTVILDSDTVESAFIVPVPAVSVMNRNILSDPVAVADAALHEACHQKLYDLMATRHIVQSGYDYLKGPLFEIPWTPINGKRRTMDAVRIVSTLHVYAHAMALLIALADSGYEHPTVADRLSDYWRRSQFFWTIAESGALDRGLGPDGQAMARWLTEIFHLHAQDMQDLGHGLDDAFGRDARRQVEALDA